MNIKKESAGSTQIPKNSQTPNEALMPKKKKKNGSKGFAKPDAFLYYLAGLIVRPFLKFKLKTTYDLTAIKDISGPALVVCPHVSNIDFLLVAIALMPHRPTFVVSYHFMTHPKLRKLLERMHVIPKKMFCPDIKTIINIMRAKESGNIIVLFPEGRLTCFGHSLWVTEGTAELVKKLAVNVYTISEDGAYKTFPKWGISGFRPGKIHVRSSKLLDAAQIETMSVTEINNVLESAILHDEDLLFQDIAYHCDSPAKGLDGILYKCPVCKEEFKMETDDHFIRCEACGFSVELDEKYQLHGGPFAHINDWYFWQEAQLDLDSPLKSETILAAVNDEGNMDVNAGNGTVTMDRDSITFEGTCWGKPLSFTEKTETVKAFPASVNKHFDIYHKKVLYNMHLKPDSRMVIKWVIYLDKLTKERAAEIKVAETNTAETNAPETNVGKTKTSDPL